MTEQEYRAAEGVSRSQLWRLHEGSPEKFMYAEEHPEEPTPALIFGQMVDSLRPHELQHTKPPCPSPTPGVHSNSCPSSR